MNTRFRPTIFAVSCLSLLLEVSLFGQASPEINAASANDTSRTVELDRVVVTGRAGIDLRTEAQTSYALTDISNEQLRLQAPMGVAEALKAVPGFWVEASGGEASANIRARAGADIRNTQ